MGSAEERERLKEEYKAHYRQILQTKQKLAESERMAKIAGTLRSMNADHLLEGMDHMLQTVREKIAMAEAKLEVAMERHEAPEPDPAAERMQAKATLDQLKMEMGMLETELETKARALATDKTLGPSERITQPDPTPVARPKTLGRKSPK